VNPDRLMTSVGRYSIGGFVLFFLFPSSCCSESFDWQSVCWSL